jgi:putative intracellular protease/amidase
VPFFVEDALKENGGDYSKTSDWESYVVTDANLITGQNPASSESGGESDAEVSWMTRLRARR